VAWCVGAYNSTRYTTPNPYAFGYKSGYRTPGGNKGEGNVTNGPLKAG
jgi:hypothetical protein